MIGKLKNVNVFGSIKKPQPKGLNMIAEIYYGDQCVRKTNRKNDIWRTKEISDVTVLGYMKSRIIEIFNFDF